MKDFIPRNQIIDSRRYSWVRILSCNDDDRLMSSQTIMIVSVSYIFFLWELELEKDDDRRANVSCWDQMPIWLQTRAASVPLQFHGVMIHLQRMLLQLLRRKQAVPHGL